MSVIGFLGTETPDLFADRVRAFHQGLNKTGYVEGRNVAVEYRCAKARNERLPALAADLVRRQVTVIAANGPAAVAAKVATTTVPIVFFSGGDPVERGLVASLNRPGGNLTGVSTLGVEVAAKQLQLLHELVPKATVMSLLVNPTTSTFAPAESRAVHETATALGLQLHVLHAGTEHFGCAGEAKGMAPVDPRPDLTCIDVLQCKISGRCCPGTMRSSAPLIHNKFRRLS